MGTEHQCEDCKEKGESKSGKETGKKIESCGEYIVIKYAQWDDAGENWIRKTKTNNKSFNIKEKDGSKQTYDRIGEVCYWERRFVYKDYIDMCIYDKDKASKQRGEYEKYTPYMG